MTTSISGSREELAPELKSLGGHRDTHSLTEVHARGPHSQPVYEILSGQSGCSWAPLLTLNTAGKAKRL